MQVQTRHFGLINVDEKDILCFPCGVPGFEDARKFTLLGKEDNDTPFFWLQSVDQPELSFVVTDPFAIKQDYFVDVDDEEVEELQIKDSDKILTLAIVTIPEDINNLSANLKAPVLINLQNNIGKQIIMKNETFPVKYYIMGRE